MNVDGDGSRIGRDPPGTNTCRVARWRNDAGRRVSEWGREAVTGIQTAADGNRSIEVAVGCFRS